MTRPSALEVQQAVAAQVAAPTDPWACLRALWALHSTGEAAETLTAARRFTAAVGHPDTVIQPLLEFSMRVPTRDYPAGSPIVREGEREDSVFLLLRGEVGLRRVGVGELGTLHQGARFGHTATVYKVARTETAIANTDVTAMILPKAPLAEIGRKLPGLVKRIRRSAASLMLTQAFPPSSPFFMLEPRQRAALFGRMVPVTVDAGTIVMHAFKPVVAACVLVSGRGHLEYHGDANRREEGMVPGEFFGALEIATGAPRRSDVVADSSFTFFALRADDLRGLLRQVPRLEARLHTLAEQQNLHTGVRSPSALGAQNTGLPSQATGLRTPRAGVRAQPTGELDPNLTERRGHASGPMEVVHDRRATGPLKTARRATGPLKTARRGTGPMQTVRRATGSMEVVPAEPKGHRKGDGEFTSTLTGNECPDCGYPDADVTCPRCGAVL